MRRAPVKSLIDPTLAPLGKKVELRLAHARPHHQHQDIGVHPRRIRGIRLEGIAAIKDHLLFDCGNAFQATRTDDGRRRRVVIASTPYLCVRV